MFAIPQVPCQVAKCITVAKDYVFSLVAHRNVAMCLCVTQKE